MEEVCDLVILHSEQVGQPTVHIETSTFSTGVYMIILRSGNRVLTRELLQIIQ